uniref:Uncharacterized protein n=1 Tax=Strigamia maritima TaxID=126957 RepID=T1IPR4_STRMM
MISLKVLLNQNNPPLGAIITAEYVKKLISVSFEWGTATALKVNDDIIFNTSNSICRYLARLAPELNLYGKTNLQKTEVDHWLTYSIGPMTNSNEFQCAVEYLDKMLTPVTYLVGDDLSLADVIIWSTLHMNGVWQSMMKNDKVPRNLLRWYKFISSQKTVQNAIKMLPAVQKNDSEVKIKIKDEGKFVELPGAEMGKLVVRFPPEASGYLHIGHAKAALLNQYYQKAFNGKLIMRFDDTNPDKEKAEFEKVILEDVELLEIKPDMFSHTSDHFDLLLSYCEQLLRQGKAFIDDTEPELMKQEREQKLESRNRNNSIVQNMQVWEEMKKGTEKGQKCCVRAKIDMQSANGCMRDPTIYRCKVEPHVKTGSKYKVYPTYDFACPIVDSMEGVTHALRTTEYHDRDDQYYWFLEQLQLKKPYIWEYSRLNMTNTVLSKRKLTWFVNENHVTGWDDPRFPTVRGILRKGMTVDGLKQFIIAQGSSRSVVTMEWDKIWSFNKKVIDPIAPRYTALEQDKLVPVLVQGVKEHSILVPKHPKNTDVGMKNIWLSSKIWIEADDAELLKEGENATFINWGNLKITKIKRASNKVECVEAVPNLEDKDYKKTLKLTWLGETKDSSLIPCVCVYLDHIISKAVLDRDDDFKNYIGHETWVELLMLGDQELANLKKSDIIQLQRKGFFICDSPYEPMSRFSSRTKPVTLIFIPDGHTKENPVASLKMKEASPKELLQSAKDKSSEKSPQEEEASTHVASDTNKLDEQICQQGVKVRALKTAKAAKEEIDKQVKVLLSLKATFKAASGYDWQPGATKVQPKPESSSANVGQLDEKIKEQGGKVREIKAAKAAKEDIDKEIKILLSLKAEYKAASGSEWQPPSSNKEVKKPVASVKKDTMPVKNDNTDGNQISDNIKIQGDKVRALKAAKASKEEIDVEVKCLQGLKTDYKAATGTDWQPANAIKPINDTALVKNDNTDGNQISDKIKIQGDKVRALKAAKASKEAIDDEVKCLQGLKADYKAATGTDWQPANVKEAIKPSVVSSPPATLQSVVDAESELKARIDQQGEKVRSLKTSAAAKGVIEAELQVLLALKGKYKDLTGQDLIGGSKKGKEKGAKKEPEKKKNSDEKKKQVDNNGSQTNVKKLTRLGLEATKEENLSDWFSQVITKSEMIEYYDVSGCYILRPWSYDIWESIKAFFDCEIKKLDVQNCYFPIFVSHSALEKEKTHVADFAPEVAWVTRSGTTELAQPIAIRPTSETVMYPSFSKWIQSHRDLPLKLNQWCNVVRWEFKHPQPFLRTREFLWQEGHTAFAGKKEAEEEVHQILELYRRVYEELLAIPVIEGRKTEKEKFAGGDFTTTVECYVAASGRGLQGATSHHLGQNFSKMFEIVFEDPEGKEEKQYVYQNSWGLSTRTIGAMIMIHGDNDGLILPPRVAGVQVIVIPCGITVSLSDDDKVALLSKCEEYKAVLCSHNIRCRVDLRDNYSPGWKFNHWELKGVPIRVEVGPRDIKQQEFVAVRRDTSEKVKFKEIDLVKDVTCLLDKIHEQLFNKAKRELESHYVVCHEWDKFCSELDKKSILLAPFCGEIQCEDNIKKDSAKEETQPGDAQGPAMGAKSLCIPFKEKDRKFPPKTLCIHPDCKNKPKFYTLFGRSY